MAFFWLLAACADAGTRRTARQSSRNGSRRRFMRISIPRGAGSCAIHRSELVGDDLRGTALAGSHERALAGLGAAPQGLEAVGERVDVPRRVQALGGHGL